MNISSFRTTTTVVLLGLMVLAAGCKTKPIKTTTLNPDQFETLVRSHTDTADWACWPWACFANYWYEGCDAGFDPANSVAVGFQHKYDHGTEPCNCWKRMDCFYRGAVKFNLSSLAGKNVVGARLAWTERGACATRLYVATSSWGNWSGMTGQQMNDPWPAGSSGAGDVEVGGTVRDWVDGNQSNFGFVFLGPDEAELHGQAQGTIGEGSPGPSCPTPVRGFSLEVRFTE
jgi:hypothetical protein